MTTILNRLRRDRRGASPWLIMASLAVFVVVSAGLATALSNAYVVSSTYKTKVAAVDAVAATARQTARLGYDAIAALPASSTVTVSIAGTNVTALREVATRTSDRVARVTVTVGPIIDGAVQPYTTCTASPSVCTIVTEMVSGAGLG